MEFVEIQASETVSFAAEIKSVNDDVDIIYTAKFKFQNELWKIAALHMLTDSLSLFCGHKNRGCKERKEHGKKRR